MLLDGRHRLAALREERRGLSSIKAEVFHGTRQEALLAAAGRNTKTALPLTRWQATNAAWAVVRMDRGSYFISKAQIARECGVSTGTVASMRARWKVWPDDLEPTGDWKRDKRNRQGCEEPMDEEEYLKQRAEMIGEVAKGIRAAVGRLPETDIEALAEAIGLVAGWRTT